MSPNFQNLTPPQGDRITYNPTTRSVKVPDCPIIPRIIGDGIGPDISKATQRVLDAAVEKVYGGKRKIAWFDAPAGELAQARYGAYLPEDTLKAIETYRVAIKGPLMTPVGGGFRSLNVTLRQELDLYACVRPVRWFNGVPAPVKRPELLDVVIFRENTEDVYAGIEYREGSPEAQKVIGFLTREMGAKIRLDSGIGVKPISISGTRRLVSMAIRYAIERGRKSVTLVHKGNIMKFTEGAFRDWGYQCAREEFREHIVTEQEIAEQHQGQCPSGKILINDRIADAMFQQALLRPDEYDVLAMPNLNGDYLSDACAAQVGGLGMAPGANIGDGYALFEATHGTAPKYAGKDMVNPGSLLLSGVMMLEYLDWKEAADLIVKALEATIEAKTVTYDLHRQMEGARKVSTSEYASLIIEKM